MEKLENIQAELKNTLSEKRYNHSVGVMKKAKELAKIYNVDEQTAALVGITHDIAKELSKEEKINYAKENHIEIDEIEKHNIGLLHAKIGADIAKKKYGFTQSMQNAIAYHTTAHPDMDLLAKIIFAADKIEENRHYEGVEELRKIVETNIDEGILSILDYIIKENVEDKKIVHPNSILTRNKILLNKQKLPK